MKDLPTLESKRMNLHTVLTGLMDEKQVHYQPDENIKLNYPCMLYMFDKVIPTYANNSLYFQTYRFTITLISNDPTDSLFDTLNNLFVYENQFIADDLTHSVFTTTF